MDRPYTIRIATAGDAIPIGRLLSVSYSTLMKPAYEAATLNAALRRMTVANPQLLASGTYYVAETPHGQLVGCGGWTREQPGTRVRVADRPSAASSIESGHPAADEGSRAHIRHFATHPDWTGRGIGRALYERCEAEAGAAGATGFDCYASLNAEGFYAALGFRRIVELVIPMGEGVNLPCILMRRSI